MTPVYTMSGTRLERIRFDEMPPPEMREAADKLHSYFELRGSREWQFSHVADRRLVLRMEKQATQLRELNDALAAKVAEWKARAEKAEAALKTIEDDRHLSTPCA